MVTSILMSPWPEDWILYARKSDITKWVKSDIRILELQYMSAQSVIVVSAQFTRVVYAKPSFCSAQDRDLMLVTMTDKELYR
ncbi:hypothetical protein CRX64_27030, partial [Klebsiella pneumoniae]